jgi:hypothetical protein
LRAIVIYDTGLFLYRHEESYEKFRDMILVPELVTDSPH